MENKKNVFIKNIKEESEAILKEIAEFVEENDEETSGVFDDEEKSQFFDKNYYLIPLKNVQKDLKYTSNREYYSDNNKGLDKLIKNIRNKMPTKVILGKITKPNKDTKTKKIFNHNIVIKEKENKQELYLDIALITPEYMNNIKEMLKRVFTTMREQATIDEKIALKKQELEQKQIFANEQIKQQKELKEKIIENGEKARASFDNILKTVSSFLHMLTSKPTDSIEKFTKNMNENLQFPLQISFDKNINFDSIFFDCASILVKESIKSIFSKDNNVGL